MKTPTQKRSEVRMWDVYRASSLGPVWQGQFLATSSTRACELAWEDFQRDAARCGREDLAEAPMPAGYGARVAS